MVCQEVRGIFYNLTPKLNLLKGIRCPWVNNFCPLLTGDGVFFYNVRMSTKEEPIVSFLREVMRQRKRLPSQLASDLGVSHATVSRWLNDKDVPNIRSCQRLAAYSGVPVEKILSTTFGKTS